ncbi:uncharacterized protein PAC_04594 [Phialocephala subalpina]|uniref:Protein kinase domain-containing protein n=1 Tax=Phialocephala subalpina TaxID=576137 RepID=A0A1L7WPK9_9HELO|nr:uncharacterized protein PAC_04594 [Phialocephala subalpina]
MSTPEQEMPEVAKKTTRLVSRMKTVLKRSDGSKRISISSTSAAAGPSISNSAEPTPTPITRWQESTDSIGEPLGTSHSSIPGIGVPLLTPDEPDDLYTKGRQGQSRGFSRRASRSQDQELGAMEEGLPEEVESLEGQLWEARIQWPKGGTQYFIPEDEFSRLVNIKSIYTELRQHMRSRHSDDYIRSLAQTVVQYMPKIFAVLVCQNLVGSISGFIAEGLTDEDMPFNNVDRSSPKKAFDLRSRLRPDRPIHCTREWKRAQIDGFSRAQWWFLAPVFEHSKESDGHWELDQNCPLPFIEDNQSSQKAGGFSRSWSVKIHPAHQLLYRSGQDQNPEIMIKRLDCTDHKDFENQVKEMREFSNDENSDPQLRLLGTYRYEGKYYLMFPMGSMNLRTYWNETPTPDFSDLTLQWSLLQCQGIAHGLMAIHEGISRPSQSSTGSEATPTLGLVRRPEPQTRYWRHGNMMPENILWLCGDWTGDVESSQALGYLVIAHFGLADFHMKSSLSESTLGVHTGAPIYAAPEFGTRSFISRSYDIWSLGCIYLEFITWIIGGSALLNQFSDYRLAPGLDTNFSDDAFYTLIRDQGQSSQTSLRAIVRPQVISWISKLIRMPRCSRCLADFLDIVMEDMLVVNPNMRISADEVHENLQVMDNKARDDPSYFTHPLPFLTKTMENSKSKLPHLPVDTGEPLPIYGASRGGKTVAQHKRPSIPEQISSNAVSPRLVISEVPISPTASEGEPLPERGFFSADKHPNKEVQSISRNDKQAIHEISSQTLRIALASQELQPVKNLLDDHFSLVAKGDFEWLPELRDHGYSTDEIAQLLLDEETDSPWIFFEPRILAKEEIILDHHQPYCVHFGGTKFTEGTDFDSSLSKRENDNRRASWTSNEESLRHIQELCGLAGIAPNNRDRRKWFGSVYFEEERGMLAASISYQPCLPDGIGANLGSEISTKDDAAQDILVKTMSNCHKALESLCDGIGYAQRRGLCCNSFTFLLLTPQGSHCEIIELVRVEVEPVKELLLNVAKLTQSLYTDDIAIRKSILSNTSFLDRIFPETMRHSLITGLFMGWANRVNHVSLVVQFLCVAFSSYLTAHLGPIQPFFLDAPLRAIRLLGSQNFASNGPALTASLYKFTCMHDMLQGPVLAFKDSFATGTRDEQESYDLFACPEDLVDTWGPGQFLASSVESKADGGKLTAIMLGGGVIKPTSAKSNTKVLHWSNETDPRHDSPVRFTRKEPLIISGVVNINATCQSDTVQRWSSFVASLTNIGTTPEYWRYTEFQAGMALMGQQFVGGQVQFNKTWTWHPGNSWKHQYLGLIADNLPLAELDRPWGVLVSACTGVARRVPLRHLLADVMPAFAGNLIETPQTWQALQPGIVQALKQGSSNVKQWYDGLSNQPDFQELQSFTRRLIRHILLVLRDTGIDRDHKTFRIACPQGHTGGEPITMCLPIPCEKASLWAQILTDTEHCATFACMTTLCFESQEHKCQGTTPWHCPSLDTAVQQLRTHKEPIVIQTQAWSLEIDAMYWIGSPESGLQAKVVKPANSTTLRLQISKSKIPQKTRARIGAMSRKRGHLRERQIDTWPAEDVLVLS